MERLRIISIGRGQFILDRLTRALTAAGHDAVSSTRFDRIGDPLLDAVYDVVGFGRAVKPDMRARFEEILRGHNPAIVSYVGMCPEVGVLMGQINYEITRAHDGRVTNFTVDDQSVVRFRVQKEVELRWKIRRINAFFQPSVRTFHTGVFTAGTHAMQVSRKDRLRIGSNFLQVEAGDNIVFTAPV
jgi:hypothetical protein